MVSKAILGSYMTRFLHTARIGSEVATNEVVSVSVSCFSAFVSRTE